MINKANKKLGWGILGTGMIAQWFSADLPKSATSRLVAVGSRDKKRSAMLTEGSNARALDSYQAVLDDPSVEAVYIALPNHLHAEWTIRAAEAGKHILCEKPFTINRAEAMEALEAVRRADVFFMEAYMYRCHPVTALAAKILREGTIGEVRMMKAGFSYAMPTDSGNIRFNNAIGGGAIMDVGGYALSMLRLPAGAARGRSVSAEPLDLQAVASLGTKSRVDEWAAASVRFEGGILGQLTTGCAIDPENIVTVWGTKGSLTLTNPWFPGRQGDGLIQLAVKGKNPKTIKSASKVPLYALEADTVARALPGREAPYPCMTWAESLAQIRAVDLWREKVGLVFDAEKPISLKSPIAGRKLSLGARAEHLMRYGQVAGSEKKVSRLVLGSMQHLMPDQAHANALLDHYFSAGGNAIDTAHVYSTEEFVGHWIASRKVRDGIFLIGKGAAFDITPEGVMKDLEQSISRLGVTSLDLYMMHRDNLEVPVGEFVDLLSGLQSKGLIKAYGGSNWTPERIKAAELYAKKKGLPVIAASSPNFCLARWNAPMWGGCVTATDEKSRAFYQRTGLPLFAWSATASGFLTGRFKASDAKRLGPNDPVVQTWFNRENLDRLQRLLKASKRTGFSPAAIALAFVLDQPMNAFALIGPQSIAEMNDSLSSLSVDREILTANALEM